MIKVVLELDAHDPDEKLRDNLATMLSAVVEHVGAPGKLCLEVDGERIEQNFDPRGPLLEITGGNEWVMPKDDLYQSAQSEPEVKPYQFPKRPKPGDTVELDTSNPDVVREIARRWNAYGPLMDFFQTVIRAAKETKEEVEP